MKPCTSRASVELSLDGLLLLTVRFSFWVVMSFLVSSSRSKVLRNQKIGRDSVENRACCHSDKKHHCSKAIRSKSGFLHSCKHEHKCNNHNQKSCKSDKNRHNQFLSVSGAESLYSLTLEKSCRAVILDNFQLHMTPNFQ